MVKVIIRIHSGEQIEGPVSGGLTFDALRGANTARLPHFRNKHGALVHSGPDGSDWSPAQWLQAVVGELGEYANTRKKFERGDLSVEEYRAKAANELADVAIYLDILAMRCVDNYGHVNRVGVNLGRAIIDKFNTVSERVGSSVCLDGPDWHYAATEQGITILSRHFNNAIDAREWAEGYCRRHVNCDWEIE